MRTKTSLIVIILALILLVSFVSAQGQGKGQKVQGYNRDIVENPDGSITQTIYSYPKYLNNYVNLTQEGDDLVMSWDGKQIKIKLNVQEKGKNEQTITDFLKSKKDVQYYIITNWTGKEYKFAWKIKDSAKNKLNIDVFSISIEDLNADIIKGDKTKQKTIIKNDGLKYYLDDGLIIDLSDLVQTNYSLSKDSDTKIKFNSKEDSDEIFLDPTVTLSLTKNTYLYLIHPDSNYGSSTLFTLDDEVGQKRNGLVQVPISSIPENSTITSANLYMKSITSATTQNVKIYALTESWTETEATWNNNTASSNWATPGGTYNSTLISTTPVSGFGWYVLNISKAIGWWNTGALTDNGLILTVNDGTGHSFYSDDASDPADRPYYSITYLPPWPTINQYSPANNTINLTSRNVNFQCNATVLPTCSSCNIINFEIAYSTSESAFYENLVDFISWNETQIGQPNKTAIYNWTTTVASDGVYYWHCDVDVTYIDGWTYAFIWWEDNKLTLDTVFPQINYSSGTPADYTNQTSSSLLINVSVVESNPSNLTYLIYNKTGLYNSSTYSMASQTSNTSKTFNLADGNYTYNVTIRDAVGHSNSTSTRHIIIDTHAPSLVLTSPKNLQEFTYNTSINVNYSVSDATIGLGSCVLSIDGGANSTLAGCANTTINVSDGAHTLALCANDTLGQLNCSSISFTVSLDAPAINLDFPLTGTYYNNGTNFHLNYTATDGNGISVCQIWHNINGTFVLNQTNSGITSGVMNFTTYNISDGNYSWNIWCNDSTSNGRFSANNRTFTIDMTFPNVLINDPITTTVGSQNIQFTDVSTDINLASCKYSIYNSSGSIDGLYENITKSCNSASVATVSGYATYTVRSYALDLAGNENYADLNVTTTASSPGDNGGGGAGQDVEKIPVVGVQNLNETTKPYNLFELEVIYARLNDYCAGKKDLSDKPTLAIQDYSGECSLTLADLKIVQARISEQGISVAEEDLIKFFRQFSSQFLFQGYESKETVEKYKLFTSVLGITNPMKINPPSLSRAFVISSNGEPRNVSYAFSVNKNIRECTIIRGENMHCEVLSNTTFRVVQYINDTNFFDKTFEGEITITSQASAQNLEVRTVPVFMTVYNLQGLILGIPAYIFGIGMIIILFVIVFLIFSNKKIRRKFNGKS